MGEEAASELEAEPAISEVIEPEAQLRSPEVEGERGKVKEGNNHRDHCRPIYKAGLF